jgi:hypothetical protein
LFPCQRSQTTCPLGFLSIWFDCACPMVSFYTLFCPQGILKTAPSWEAHSYASLVRYFGKPTWQVPLCQKSFEVWLSLFLWHWDQLVGSELSASPLMVKFLPHQLSILWVWCPLTVTAEVHSLTKDCSTQICWLHLSSWHS